ncbi:MAG: winged helix-turn-helix domain-containing protein [Pyrinomonadaceae bacterium]
MQEKFFFDNFEADALKRTLLKDGRPVRLNPKSLDLLLALLTHHGEVLSKQALLDLVWENQFVEEKNLTVHVAALRKVLGESKDEHRFIVTVPGNGYKFVAELTQPEEHRVIVERSIEAPGVIPQNDLSAPRGQSRGRLILGLCGATLLIAALIGGYLWQSRRKSHALTDPPPQNISIRRLTSDGKATSSVLSPDGKLFVYSHDDGENQSLWLGHLDGGDPFQIRPPAHVIYLDFKFSPDASSLYYTLTEDNGGGGAVYKMPVFGGVPEKIEDRAYSITFSPSGTQLAFVRSGAADARPVLVVSDADGKNEKVLTVLPDQMSFVRQSLAWSPDGSTIAVGLSRNETNADYDVFTVSAADGSLKPLTNADWNRVGPLAWLADGSGMVMIGQKAGSIQPQLWFASFPNGEVKHLVSDLNGYGSTISLGKDQNSLLVIQGQAQSNIWVAPADDLAQAKQVTFGSIGRMDGWYGLAWMPDGKIAYTVQGGENNTIWTMNASGGEQKQLIPSEGNNLLPSVSTDDRFLVFQSDRGGSYAVWRANRDGSDILKLTYTGIAAQPDISPDGRSIVYVSHPDNSGELWRATISGGAPVKLADGASWPQISPDSRFVACGFLVDRKNKLAIFSMDGGDPVRSYDLPPRSNLRLGIHWTPDGKAVTYRDWVDGIWRQDIAGGEPQRLKGLPQEKLYAYDWSLDGKLFAFTRGVESRDVVLISNFR